MRIVHSSSAISRAVDSGGPLELNVLFTSPAGAMAAIHAASKLAGDLSVRIRLIVPQVVPFPLALTEPPVKSAFIAQRIQRMLQEQTVEAEVQVCLCRDKLDAPLSVLRPHSLVVIGGRRQWWPTEEARLARELRRRGHEVLLVGKP